MIAYKGFNKDLTCTKGKGTFQYAEGVLYRESEANCAKNGFHCAENPMDCLSWYENYDESAYYEVEASGDIDDIEDKIACTEMKLLKGKRLNEVDFLAAVGNYYINYPLRRFIEKENGWLQAKKDTLIATNDARAVIVRGKEPKVSAPLGCYVYVLQEDEDSLEIKSACIYRIDGKKYEANRVYQRKVAE